MAIQMPPAQPMPAPHPGPAAFGRKLPMHNEEMPKVPAFGHEGCEAPKFGASHDNDTFTPTEHHAHDAEEPAPVRQSLKAKVKDALKAPFKKLAQLFRKKEQ